MVCEFQPHLRSQFEDQPNLTLSKNSSWPNFEEIAMKDEIRRKKLLSNIQPFNSCPDLNDLISNEDYLNIDMVNRKSENSSCHNLESFGQ